MKELFNIVQENIIQKTEQTDAQENKTEKTKAKINLKKDSDKLKAISQLTFEHFDYAGSIHVNNVDIIIYKDSNNELFISTLDYNNCLQGIQNCKQCIVDASDFINIRPKLQYPVLKYGYQKKDSHITYIASRAIMFISLEGCKSFIGSYNNKKHMDIKQEIYNAMLDFNESYKNNSLSSNNNKENISSVQNTEEKETVTEENKEKVNSDITDTNNNTEVIISNVTVSTVTTPTQTTIEPVKNIEFHDCLIYITNLKTENENLKQKNEILTQENIQLNNINKSFDRQALRNILDEIINSNFEPQTITKIILMSIKIMGKRNSGNNLTYSAIWNTYNNNLDKIIPGLGYANGQSKYIYVVKEKGKKKEAIIALVNTSHELFGNVDCILFAIKDIFKFRFLEESVFYLKQFQIYEPYPILKTEEIEIYEKTLQEIQKESEKNNN